MRVQRCDATLGALVTDLALAAIDDPTWESIEAAFHEHALLIFPGQHLSSAEQRAFGRRFGALERDLVGEKGVVVISNREKAGAIRSPEDEVMHVLRGNEGWHTDSSYMPVSAKASLLSAHVVPATGGQTEWADMRAAYDVLSHEMKTRIDGLCARHSIRYSQARAGLQGEAGYGTDVTDPPLRPLVKRHPVTGRPSLFIGRHAHAIPGLAPSESEALLDELLAAACVRPRVHRHTWEPGDIAVWDNRCVLHRALPYDYTQPRVMKHTRIAGDPATEHGI